MASELGVQTIQHTNGTDALTIGTGGIISQSAPVGFSVSINEGSNQPITTGAYAKLQFTYNSSNAFHFDTHSGWSNSNYYYTVPTGCGGYWLLNTIVEMSDSGTQNLVVISKNAGVGSNSNFIARLSAPSDTSMTGNTGHNLSCIVNLSDGDIVKSEVYHNYGSNVNALEVGNYLRTGMQGWRLG